MKGIKSPDRGICRQFEPLTSWLEYAQMVSQSPDVGRTSGVPAHRLDGIPLKPPLPIARIRPLFGSPFMRTNEEKEIKCAADGNNAQQCVD